MSRKPRRWLNALRDAPRWTRAVVVAVASAAVVAYGMSFVWHWVIDDAGISFAYARHLVGGEGLVAVPGGYNVEGYSNFLWVLILAAVDAVGLALPAAAKVLGAAFGLVTIALCVGVVQRLDGRRFGELRWEDLTPALLLGWADSFVVWMPSGLENTLFTALLMATVLLDLGERDDPGRFPWSAPAALGVALCRPEGILYAAGFGGLKLIDALTDRRFLRQMFAFAACTLGGFLLYHAWHFWQFADLLPNTYYAKNPGDSAEKFESGWAYLEAALVDGGYVYLAPLAVLGAVRPLRRVAGVVGVVAVGAFFALYSGGDWMPHGRFLSYFLPAIVVLVHLGVCRLVDFLTGEARRLHQPVALALMVGLAMGWGARQLPVLEEIDDKQWCHFCRRVDNARVIKDLSGRLGLSTSSVLTHDFGGFAWESTEAFMPVDHLGLCDPTLARVEALKESSGPLARRHGLQYVFHELERPPTYIYLPGSWWEAYDEAAEFRRGYYELPAEQLGRSRRRGARFSVHRGAFVDYFASVERFDFDPLTESLTMLGHALTPAGGDEGAGGRQRVRFEAAILTSEELSKPPSWRLRVRRGDRAIETRPEEFFGGMASLVRQWQPGEPYRLEAEFAAPVGEGPVSVSLGIREAEKWRWRRLGEVDSPREDGAEHIAPPAYPRELPAPDSSELAELRRRVWRLDHRRRARRDLTIQDTSLSERLQDVGERLEDTRPDQAYLAYVLALQADRSRSAQLYEPIWELRPLDADEHYSTALDLLQAFYRTGEPGRGVRAAEFFARAGDRERARFLAERVVADEEER